MLICKESIGSVARQPVHLSTLAPRLVEVLLLEGLRVIQVLLLELGLDPDSGRKSPFSQRSFGNVEATSDLAFSICIRMRSEHRAGEEKLL